MHPDVHPGNSSSAPSVGEDARRLGRSMVTHPVALVLLTACCATLVYFFGYAKLFTGHSLSAAAWALAAWNPENNQEHSIAIFPIAIFLIWYHRKSIQEAKKIPSNAGLLFLVAGLLFFVIAARTLQPRIAICALPLLIYGGVRFVWGREVGRIFIFPCLFLLFMVPIGGIVQGTVTLQLLVSSCVKFMSALVGARIETIGTTIRALDGSFNFEIAEGCSGIRSLMAMSTLAALYVHFTQREVWKQVVIFAGSILFALIGNIGRIFSVVLFAKFISPRIASGLYHDYSGFLFFPIAVVSMVSFSKLLNLDWQTLTAGWLKPEEVTVAAPAEISAPGHEMKKEKANPISYDY